jgi:hypothetical protein
MTNREVIGRFLEQRRQAIISRIKQASGRTARSIYHVEDSVSGVLYGPSHITTLEDGRPPTKDGAPRANPSLREAIEEWLQYAGISPKPGQTRRSLAYAIANSIHRKGTRLWQQGGRSGVLSETITERSFEQLIDDLAAIETLSVQTEVVNKFRLELTKKI